MGRRGSHLPNETISWLVTLRQPCFRQLTAGTFYWLCLLAQKVTFRHLAVLLPGAEGPVPGARLFSTTPCRPML